MGREKALPQCAIDGRAIAYKKMMLGEEEKRKAKDKGNGIREGRPTKERHKKERGRTRGSGNPRKERGIPQV